MRSRQDQLRSLRNIHADVVIVGGGITGVCAALDATQRGLKAVLLERDDFGGATSAQSLKILHGGIRYLQHLDIRRLRESCHERAAFLRIAPHMTRPLAFAVPTYGHGMQGKMLFRGAFALLALLTADRNRDIADSAQRIPNGHFMTREEVLNEFPHIAKEGLTGAAVFSDGQILNPPRLVYAIANSADSKGAVCLNYFSADSMQTNDGKVASVIGTDRESGESIRIKTRSVINAAGPYAGNLFKNDGGLQRRRLNLSRDMALVVKRPWKSSRALAAQTKYRDPDAVLSRGNRHLFIVPWRDYTLIGVNSKIYRDDPDQLSVSESEIVDFIEEINEAVPMLDLTRDDIAVVNAGLLPFGDNEADSDNLSFGKRSLVSDDSKHGGAEGSVTAVSVRWTMGRATAKAAVDVVEKMLCGKKSACNSHLEQILGGQFNSFDQLLQDMRSNSVMAKLGNGELANIAMHFGSEWHLVANMLAEIPGSSATLAGTKTVEAQIHVAARYEGAVHLSDVILRRSDMGSGELPSEPALRLAASIMGQELGWDEGRIQSELEDLKFRFPFSNGNAAAESLQGAA